MISQKVLQKLAQKHGYEVRQKNDKFITGDNIDGALIGEFDTEYSAWLFAAGHIAKYKAAKTASTARLYARVLKVYEAYEWRKELGL